MLRTSPATPGLLGTWRQPQLEPCPTASPLSWTRLVTQRLWLVSSKLSRGVGAAPSAWLGLNSSPEARAFPDALAAVKGAGSCQQQGSGRGPPAAGRPDGCNMCAGDRAGCTGVSLCLLLDTAQDPPSPVLPFLYPARLCVRLGGGQQHPKSFSILGGDAADPGLLPTVPQLLDSCLAQ